MPDPALHVADLPAGVALIPGAVELLGCPPELDRFSACRRGCQRVKTDADRERQSVAKPKTGKQR
jgi:hypothetical protein